MIAIRIEPIKAKTPDLARLYAQIIEREFDIEAKAIEKDFEFIVETWDRKPKFVIRKLKSSHRLTVMIFTTDKIFNYLNHGTEPHIITPVRANMLHFQSGYTAKSRPRWIGGQQGGGFGDDVFAKRVQHPGTEARKWDEAIARKRRKSLALRINQKIAQANRKLK